jgi:hypothetical protein
MLLAPDEPRAPIAILSPAKRAALTACLNGGSLQKQSGVWTASFSPCNKPIFGVAVADADAEHSPSKRVCTAHHARKLVRPDSGDRDGRKGGSVK